MGQLDVQVSQGNLIRSFDQWATLWLSLGAEVPKHSIDMIASFTGLSSPRSMEFVYEVVATGTSPAGVPDKPVVEISHVTVVERKSRVNEM